MKVRIGVNEHWPVYELDEHWGVEVEVDEATLADWERVRREWVRVQAEMDAAQDAALTESEAVLAAKFLARRAKWEAPVPQVHHHGNVGLHSHDEPHTPPPHSEPHDVSQDGPWYWMALGRRLDHDHHFIGQQGSPS